MSKRKGRSEEIADGVERITKSDGNVFADIGFDEPEAANLKMKVGLIIALEEDLGRKN